MTENPQLKPGPADQLNDRYRVTWGDRLLAVGIGVLALAGMVVAYSPSSGESARWARVLVDGRVVREISLAGDARIHQAFPGGGSVDLEVEAGRLRVAFTDCPESHCRRRGWVSRPGETVVCVPRRLVVEITGQKGVGDCDAVAY
jgi:hypothetical protein